MSLTPTKRIVWLDIAKCFAIIAVLVDHTQGYLYHNKNIAICSYFSVSLFIIIAGITCYLSFSNPNKVSGVGGVKLFVNKTKGILIAYLFATVIYSILSDKGFVFQNILNKLIYFNASAPLYYVLLYISLMIVAFPLYKLIVSCEASLIGVFKELCILISVIVLSVFTTRFSDILGVYGGGGKLFGGTYLILFTLGIIIAKHFVNKDFSKITYIILMLIGLFGYAIWLITIFCFTQEKIDSIFPFGEGKNPPSICFMLLSVFVLLFVWGITELFNMIGVLKPVLNPFRYIGQHTLYIFLFHMLFFVFIQKLPIGNIWIIRIICYPSLIIGSLILEFIIRKIQIFLSYLFKPMSLTDKGAFNEK